MTGMKMSGGTSVAPGREMLAPRMCRSTNRQVDPEAWFRIVHLAQDGLKCAPVAAYREQIVQISLSGFTPSPTGTVQHIECADTRQFANVPLDQTGMSGMLNHGFT